MATTDLLGRGLERWGRLVTARPRATLLASLAVLAALLVLAVTAGGTPRDDYDVKRVEANTGWQLLLDHLPEVANASAVVVVHDGQGPVSDADIVALTKNVTAVPHVAGATVLQATADRRTVALDVRYDREVTDPAVMGQLAPLEKSFQSTKDKGFQVDATGPLPISAAQPFDGTGEIVGVIAAAVILLLTLRSVIAAGLPLLTSLVGLAGGGALVLLLARIMQVSTIAPTVAAMVGLGVGLDYCLLVTVRLIGFRRSGQEPRQAALSAVQTAGRSVLFAGITVLLALTGLSLSGLPIFHSFAYATALAVLAAMASALTLGPCLGMLYARRVQPAQGNVLREQLGVEAEHSALTARLAARMVRTPIRWILVAVLVLVPLCWPAFSMHTWPQDANNEPTSFTTRRAEDALAKAFGEGFNATLLAVLPGDLAPAEVQRFSAAVSGLPRVSAVTPVAAAKDGSITVVAITPGIRSTNPATPELLRDVRRVAPAGVHITGDPAYNADIADLLEGRLGLVMAFVIGAATLLLGLLYRSVAVPIKAALMNMLSIGAAYGAMTLVFQQGHGLGLLGVDQPVAVSSYVLMLMFTILFGLSMDYEVFILSRVKELYDQTGHPRESVTSGLAATATVVTSAAAVMIAVFAGFAAEDDLVVKQMGFGMAVAVFLDATLIRLVLVPATMSLLGRWNWWPGNRNEEPRVIPQAANGSA